MAEIAMAAAALGMPAGAATDAILRLLDETWYSQSILNGSRTPLSLAGAMEVKDGKEMSAAGTSSNVGAYSGGAAPGEGLERRGSGMTYHVDESEMKKVFERFDENADGKICSRELRRYMNGFGINMTESDVSSMINAVDSDRDGKVDFQEFFALYKQCVVEDGNKDAEAGPRDDEDDLLEAFRIFDKDGDGFIVAQELHEVLAHLGMQEGRSLSFCENMIRSVDRDGNGRCDVEEFAKMMSEQKL